MDNTAQHPTESSVTREELHRRSIDLRFYSRSDGLYEVVAHLSDTKTHPFHLQLRDTPIAAHTPIHDMIMTLVVDEDLVVKDIKAQMKATPFGVCLGAQRTLAGVIGLKIGPGWSRKIKDLLSGSASCTHLMELLGPIATTAFQGIAPKRLAEVNNPMNEQMRVVKVNSCYAYAEHRDVVAQLWPSLYKPTASAHSTTKSHDNQGESA
jgi:hypothetical protein